MNNGELLSVLEHIERETARKLCEPEGSLSATQSGIPARKKPIYRILKPEGSSRIIGVI